jgi:hypothetical protein
MVVNLSALRAGRLLPPRKFLVLIPVRGRPQGHTAAGRIMSIEKSNYPIENRTRDLPACSIVPQPTTLPRALHDNNSSLTKITTMFDVILDSSKYS